MLTYPVSDITSKPSSLVFGVSAYHGQSLIGLAGSGWMVQKAGFDRLDREHLG